VSFPDYWTPQIQQQQKDRFIEDVCIALFTEAENNAVLEGCKCVYWLDTDQQTQQAVFNEGEAYLRIVRLGGEVDLEEQRTIHRVQFAALTDSRNESWGILAFVQWVLYAFRDTSRVLMPNGAKVPVKFLGERLGPLLDPQQIRDFRLVPVTVELETPLLKGLPKAELALGL
jgi:hypothetical protein